MQPILPPDSHEPSSIPDSDRLKKRFQENWRDINEASKDPNATPLERVLKITFGMLASAFVSLNWQHCASWFVFVILAVCFLAVCFFAYFARLPSQTESPPEPRPQSKGEGTIIRTPDAH